MEVSITDAQINILLEIEGKLHLVAMPKSDLDAVALFTKSLVSAVVPTKRTQRDLAEFLAYKPESWEDNT